ncbi:MAG: radical SAM protein [Planctomycetaceae bacterium]|nr:radical SAM protein [Planctomycetaceae bacterium]
MTCRDCLRVGMFEWNAPAMRSFPSISDQEILAHRGIRNHVDESQPGHVLVERELSARRQLETVGTVFLTNRECPFRCLMCDLWKNTTEHTVAAGAIPHQIAVARSRFEELCEQQTLTLPAHIKLYNSGNFFDAQAIPRDDWAEIAKQVGAYHSVIVENHPRLCGPGCIEFRDLCDTTLEIAMGLESSDEQTLRRLNKRMTVTDFSRACEFLLAHGIRLRSFVLLKPPGLTEEQGIEQAIRSVQFAVNCGVDCCAVIPTRGGNGILEVLSRDGFFQPPLLSSLEAVMEEIVGWGRARCFADLWDLQQFSACDHCFTDRRERLRRMNETQQVLPAVRCDVCTHSRDV